MPAFAHQRSFWEPSKDHGFWSPSTSAANFCEEDYIRSYYIAEFVNTISNLAYVYYAIYPPLGGLDTLRKQAVLNAKGTWALQDRKRTAARWDIQSIALVLIGITSGIFHATLHRLPQWTDESSMYLLAGSWIYTLLTTSYVRHSDGTSNPRQLRQFYKIVHKNEILISASIVASLAFATSASYWTGDLAIHSVVFGSLLVLSGVKMGYLIVLATSSPEAPALTLADWFSMSEKRWILVRSLARSFFFLILALTLWLLDTNPDFCYMLRHVRNDILGKTWYLQPLGMLLELHGWWHIFTARAAGEYISLVRTLTQG